MDISIYTAVTGDGVEAHVFSIQPHRFEVRVLDADAGQWVPGQVEFLHFEEATDYADYCVRK